MAMQFATAKHLHRLWRLLRSLISATDERLEALEKILRVNDTGEDLLTITDAAHRILAAIESNGRARFDAGLTAREATTTEDHRVEGTMHLKGTRLMESDDYGLYYILDKEDRILFMIDRDGNTDFKGIPTDIKAELDGIKGRLEGLERL